MGFLDEYRLGLFVPFANNDRNLWLDDTNPIPVKTALNLMGKEVGPLRMPMTEMEEAHQEVLKKAMKDFGIELA